MTDTTLTARPLTPDERLDALTDAVVALASIVSGVGCSTNTGPATAARALDSALARLGRLRATEE